MLRNVVEVRGPYVIIFLNQTSTCEQHVTWFINVSRHEHETCYNEIGLCDQNDRFYFKFNSGHN